MQCQIRRTELTHERRLFVTPDIHDLLEGRSPELGFPNAKAAAFVDRFMAGHLMCVSLLGVSSDAVEIEKLRDLDEVWALCLRRPKPGWRIFGRFMAKDCFVALKAFDRCELGRRAQYAGLAEATIESWNLMFPGRDPHRGSLIGDYLGGVLRDVDEND